MFSNDQLAVVTGGSRGIGAAIATDLARNGATVCLTYSQNEYLAVELVEKLSAEGHAAFARRLDVASEGDVRRFFRDLRRDHGSLEILVNNAGVAADGLALMMSTEKWDRVLTTNLSGTFWCCREAGRTMARAHRGAIVNVSSVSGLLGTAGQANYAASKAAVIALTKTLAAELAPHHIRVNCVVPGLVETDMVKHIPKPLLDLQLTQVPLGRMGSPDEAAFAVTYLASEKASYVTGSVLVVDGGLTRH